MRPNKALFLGVFDHVVRQAAKEGFVPHPVAGYDRPMWEPTNQYYRGCLLHSDVTQFVTQFEVSFRPKNMLLRYEIYRSKTPEGIASHSDFPNEAGAWTDMWLFEPHDHYLLLSPRFLRFWPTGPWFKVNKKRLMKDPVAVKEAACRAFDRQAQHLFACVNGIVDRRFVDADRRHIKPLS